MAGTVRDNLVFAATELMATIFDTTESVYATIEANKRLKDKFGKLDEHEGYAYSYATGTFYAFGKNESRFLDKLNYSAWVIDYTLAETFSLLFATLKTIVPPSMVFNPNGSVTTTASKFQKCYMEAEEEVGTPSPGIREIVYIAEQGMALAKAGAFLTNTIGGIIAKVKAGVPDDDDPPVEEAL
jgi:hypothetical protein